MALPVTKVVLFRHGVAYFEREKQVNGNESLELQFKDSEMNDVLKSLCAVDMNGGIVSSISYGSKKPIERQLEELSVHLTSEQYSLTELISQAVGARVSLVAGGSDTAIEGVIAGVDTTDMVGSDGRAVSVQRLNLLKDGGTLVAFPLFDIENFTFLEATLKRDLEHLLNICIMERKKDTRKICVFAKGEGPRLVVMSYIVESPVWKTSYRLHLQSDGKMYLSGWAIVDNTTEEDWKAVALSLVNGLPNSFIRDLYNPQFKKRPVLAVVEDPPTTPPVLKDVLPNHSESLLADAPAMLSSLITSNAKMVQASVKSGPPPPRSAPLMPAYGGGGGGGSGTATARKVGSVDFFQYHIENPVSVKRGQSALVPFLHAEFAGACVQLFNKKANATHPLSVVRFVNTFGVTLEGGPLTLFDEGTCIGEAMLDTIRHEGEKFVPFGTETSTTITMGSSHSTRPHHATSVNAQGALTVSRWAIETITYTIVNGGEKNLDLYIEHPAPGTGRLIVETQAHDSKTESYFRYRVAVGPKATARFDVHERYDQSFTWYLFDYGADYTASALSNNYIDKATHDNVMATRAIMETIQKARNDLNTANSDVSTQARQQATDRDTLDNWASSAASKKVSRSTVVDQIVASEKLIIAANERILGLENEIERLEAAKEAQGKLCVYSAAF